MTIHVGAGGILYSWLCPRQVDVECARDLEHSSGRHSSMSNMDYFGDPVFIYSLRQGISDGFLAPYKVIKVHIDRDVEGYRPELGQLDRDGNEVEDRGPHL
jgi:hypothetical protein